MVIQRVGSASFSKDVLYIGSAIPLETSEGLEAVQMPLRHRYPTNDDGIIKGMMATITILPSGIQLRFKEDAKQLVLFPYSTLTLCAAVRCIKVRNENTNEMMPRFVSLTSQEAGGLNSDKPAIYTAITRRTKGRQVLECHGFITQHPSDALELVKWTGVYDRRSKQLGNQSIDASMPNGASFETMGAFTADTSFRTDTGSLHDHPIQLVPGDAVPDAPPAAYQQPPKNGYFYTTKSAQVRRFSLQKFGVEDTITVNGAPVVNGGGAAAMENNLHDTEVKNVDATLASARSEHLQQRRGYAGSTYSAPPAPPGHYAYRPRQAFMVPVRQHHPHHPHHAHPMMVRPVIIAAPSAYGYNAPGFFVPPQGPPHGHRAPYMVPGPPPPAGFFERPHRRGSKGSSSSRTSSAGSPRPAHLNGKASKKHVAGDSTGSEGSRPATPPTDYEASRGPRLSRKEEHYMRQGYNIGDHGGYYFHRGPSKNLKPLPPHGYYMMPAYPPPPGMVRARSVPPYGESRSLNRKDKKKSKKSKKDGKGKKSKKGHREPYHDESTDSVGYTSEFGFGHSSHPRELRRFDNQFQHERAFSKSLAEEKKKSTRGENGMSAYSLNPEHHGEY